LEDSSVGLNGDGDWSLVDGSLKLLDRVGWDVGVSSNVDETLGGIKFAGSWRSGSGGITVVSLGLLLGFLEVLESLGLPSTATSVAGGIAGDEFLLGKGEEFSWLEEMSSLNSAGGWESPAWSALSLVLDGVNGTLGSPVLGGGVGWLKGNVVSDSLAGLTGITEELLVLGSSPGGHVVVTDGEVLLSGVDLLDLGVLLGEEVHSELEFLLGSVRDSVFRHVLNEGLLELELILGDDGVSEDSEDGLHGESRFV
jgi:hypothetical protein